MISYSANVGENPLFNFDVGLLLRSQMASSWRIIDTILYRSMTFSPAIKSKGT